jgi:phosphatidylserine decarboxylase
MTIHREGYWPLVITVVVLTVLNVLFFTFLPTNSWPKIIMIASVILFLLILQFFRNPKIITELDPNKVYAPADGKVVVIEQTLETEYLNEPRIQVSIFMSPLNVHINRNPVSGVVKRLRYHAGKYLVAWHPKSSTENERTTLVVETTDDIEIVIRQIAGAMARRIKYYVGEGDEVIQGEEFGFIRFGSRVDVFLPLNASIQVEQGQKTTAGKTIIAMLASQAPTSNTN